MNESKTQKKVFNRSVASIVAATIGAGIFGVPYVMAKAGVIVGLIWVVLVSGIVIVENLLLADISLRMPDDLRFIGIAKAILSKRGAMLVQLLTMISFLGALVAYLILGGKFLHVLISLFFPISEPVSTLIYFILSSAIILFGFAFIERLDEITILILITLIAIVTYFAAPHISGANLMSLNLDNFFLPYGVILFALGSAAIVPTLEASLGENKFMLRRVIITAVIIASLITAIFGIVVVGVSGQSATQDAITGLASYLGNSIIILGSLIGFVAIIGINTLSGNNLREIFENDYKFPKIASWLLVILVPLLVVLSGSVNFISLLGLMGGVIGGFIGVAIAWMYIKSYKIKSELARPKKYNLILAYLVMLAFIAGAGYELYFSFLK